MARRTGVIGGSGRTQAGRPDGKSQDEAKQIVLDWLARGCTVTEALKQANRSRNTYERWRSTDKWFAERADRAKAGKAAVQSGDRLSFAEFSEKYFGMRVFPHIQNVVDLIEGREPGWLHPAMVYEQGEPDLLMALMPPEHSKTASLTINMTTWAIAMNPNIRVIIISKSTSMARKMLLAIKSKLTHPQWAEFQRDYGPPGGFDADSEAWNADRIYISPALRDSGEKDPTVEALGIGSQIYGARADLIICDDVIDLGNAAQFESQIDWLQREVFSRVAQEGRILMVGTRLWPRDLYAELRNPRRYPDEQSPWTFLSMPAVLEAADDPKDWVTLWPKSNVPEVGARNAEPDEDGLFPKWDGPTLAKRRARMTPAAWSLVYQQADAGESAVFNLDDIMGCVNGARMKGLLPRVPAVRGGEGMDGLICVAGLDPAASGFTAAVCIGLDPKTRKRYILDISNKAGMRPDEIRNLIKDWIVKYRLSEFRIERNAFQSFLSDDREINQFAASRNCLIKPHFTGAQKNDPDFGVASMAPLFHGWETGENVFDLPSMHVGGGEVVRTLMEQLTIWYPGMPKRQKQDIVMALWFANLAAAERDVKGQNRQTHVRNGWLGKRDLEKRVTINLDDYLAQQHAQTYAVL